jgi:hypothetical protein
MLYEIKKLQLEVPKGTLLRRDSLLWSVTLLRRDSLLWSVTLLRRDSLLWSVTLLRRDALLRRETSTSGVPLKERRNSYGDCRK